MYSPQPKPALDALMRTPYDDIYNFGHASAKIRELLGQSEGVVVEPQRGATPLSWAACGLVDVESSPLARVTNVAIPIGTYQRFDLTTGLVRYSGSTKNTKAQLLASGLEGLSQVRDGLTIIDEVQMGGTITNLATNALRFVTERDIPTSVHVIAAEAPRYNGHHTSVYDRMVAGIYPGVLVEAVQTPLIACDRNDLLPQIVYKGRQRAHNEDEDTALFEVQSNSEAELLFRCIGTMARQPEFAHDKTSVCGVIAQLNTSFGSYVETWVDGLVERFSPGRIGLQ